MKTKIIACLLLALLTLSVVCARQWSQLRELNQRLAADRQALSELAANRDSQVEKVKQLEAHRARLGENIDQFTSLVNTLRAKESGYASNLARLSPAGNSPSRADGSGSDPAKAGSAASQGLGNMFSKMLKDPAMKEMVRSQQKIMAQKMYGPLCRDLNLAPEQKDQLMGLLQEHQMAAVEQAGALFGSGESDQTKISSALKDKEKELDTQVKSLLGEEKFAQYSAYKTTLGERMQLDQLRQQLEGGNAPLQDEQMQSLLQVMKEERDKTPPVIPNKKGEGAANFAQMLTDETMEKQFQWQEDLNRRVLERAGQILTPQQLKEYTDFQTQQLTMQKAGMRMAREMFGGGNPPSTEVKVEAPPTR
jgi:hypothetical protein